MTKKVIIVTKDNQPLKVYATAPDVVVEFVELESEDKGRLDNQLRELKDLKDMHEVFEL